MKRTSNKQEKRWKSFFFTLLIINALVVLVLAYYLYPLVKPVAERERPLNEEMKDIEDLPFYINANKETTMKTIENYLAENDYDFIIELDDYVNFKTNIRLFGLRVDLHAQFTPSVEKDGALKLKQESISLGRLTVPNDYAIRYIANAIDLPEWLYLVPEDEELFIDFSEHELSEDFSVEFDKVDLKNDDIQLKLYMNKSAFKKKIGE